ncbi:NADPH:quinone oxidoreductase family protein [Streptomyces sp. NBC_00663]|uniref:NADPH:quinone oxidoreductase family protein n=1 Tax=Streptomyces sp. NBC_00663 TaxID=2975801 RepID=UPI002E37CDDF|nr:NADPH:quinone oxidoreductase family protein [Streptomyces sp. NBC_00663]
MQGALVTAFEGPDALVIGELPEPEAQEGQVLIDVEWAGVVFPDVLQTRGEYQTRPELPFVPGWELSGTVRTDAAGFRAGDRVAALPVTGGFAQTAAVDASMVFPLPDNIDTRRGAALPLNYLTAHFALAHRGALRPGEVVLVHGAAGGVGSAACQLAAAHGARVIAVVSTKEKADLARSVGAHEVVGVGGFLEEVKALTDGRGVDLVVDPVGGDRFPDSLRALRHGGGRLLVLGFAGRGIPTVKVNRLLLTNTSVLGVGMDEYWRQDPGAARAYWRELWPLLRSGRLDPPISSVFPLEQASAALKHLDQRRGLGRTLLRIGA